MYDLGGQQRTASTPEGIMKGPRVSVSDIGHSDIRGLGRKAPSVPKGQWSARALSSITTGGRFMLSIEIKSRPKRKENRFES